MVVTWAAATVVPRAQLWAVHLVLTKVVTRAVLTATPRVEHSVLLWGRPQAADWAPWKAEMRAKTWAQPLVAKMATTKAARMADLWVRRKAAPMAGQWARSSLGRS
jgi:hypothetical protein